MWRLPKQLIWFSAGGLIGDIVDGGVVQLLTSKLGVDPYTGRLFSFLCAATATWVFNRRFTFHKRGEYTLFGEWSRYIAAMTAGFVVNYAAYALLVYFVPFVHTWPAIGVFAAGMPGAAVNFLGARHWVFPGTRKGSGEGAAGKSKHDS
ncbi:MAG TPA: GtrA family protein [Rhodanobacteraceae bacterium]